MLHKKEKKTEKSSALENAKRIECEREVRDCTTLPHSKNSLIRPTKLSPRSKGLFQVVEKHENRAVKIQRRGYREAASIARISPFLERMDAQEQDFSYGLQNSWWWLKHPMLGIAGH